MAPADVGAPAGTGVTARDQSTNANVVALTRAFCRAGGSVEEEMSFYGPDPIYDVSPMGIGVFQGRPAIRRFLADWMSSYEGYHEDVQEVVDCGNGVAFAAVRESGRPTGGTVDTRTHSTYGFAIVWIDGKIGRMTAYPDIDEARAAAERLAEERA
jgi:ketosteroid isomerase-like protein